MGEVNGCHTAHAAGQPDMRGNNVSVTPDLTTHLGPNLTLATPVIAASGTFGYGEEIADLADCGSLSALITPTLTLQPRRGNAMPRTAEASAGLLHATGLPNPGLEAFIGAYLPGLRALPCPLIVSIATEAAPEWAQMAQRLAAAGGIAALELNLTPFPLLVADRAAAPYPVEAALLERIREAVAAVRAVTDLPLLAKLPPIGADIGAAAQAAASVGADAISVSQAFPGIAVRLSRRRFRFPGVVGGLSGPCIKPLALFQVWRAALAVPLPIVGSGGIMTAEDALEFLVAGASLVAVGTASFVHPTAIADITAGIAAYLAAHRLADLRSLVGAGLRAGR